MDHPLQQGPAAHLQHMLPHHCAPPLFPHPSAATRGLDSEVPADVLLPLEEVAAAVYTFVDGTHPEGSSDSDFSSKLRQLLADAACPATASPSCRLWSLLTSADGMVWAWLVS